MALESTIVPIPSETIVPPAAYLARTHGGLSIAGVVLAATLGSWVGASVMYWGARWLGRPLVMRLAPYLGLSVSKIELAERWSAHYGWTGVFFSRLLPVIRHLIGIPAGILRLDFRWYAAATSPDRSYGARCWPGSAPPLVTTPSCSRAHCIASCCWCSASSRCSERCTTSSCSAPRAAGRAASWVARPAAAGRADRELREYRRRRRVDLGHGIRALQVRDGLADRAVPDRLMRPSVEHIDHDPGLVLDPGAVISPAAAPAVPAATPAIADAPARPPAGIVVVEDLAGTHRVADHAIRGGFVGRLGHASGGQIGLDRGTQSI